MSNIVRFEPMREMMSLREAMNQLFDDSFTRPFSLSGSASMPAVDMYQDDENVVVKASLPGLRPEDVQISVTADVLNLHGEYAENTEKKEKTYLIHEQRSGSFDRSVRLPVDVQTDKARAEFENGILTITLPKAEAVRPKTITIKPR